MWFRHIYLYQSKSFNKFVKTKKYLSTNQKNNSFSEKDYSYAFNSIIDNISIGFYKTDSEGFFKEFNQQLLHFLSLTPDNIHQNSLFSLFKFENDLIQFRQILLLEKKVSSFEALICDSNKKTLYVNINAIRVVNNGIEYIEGTIEDNYEKVKTLNALKLSEEKYKTLIELSNDSIVIHRDGKVLFANKRAYQFLGYNYLDDFSNIFDTVVSPQEKENINGFQNNRLKGYAVPELYETVLLDKNGNPVYVEATNTLVAFEQDNAIMSVLRDITPRIEAERKLYMLGSAIKQISEVVVITDTKGIVEYVNPAFEHISQYDQKEIIGKSISIIKSQKHHAEFYKELWSVISSGNNWAGTIVNKKKNGELYEEYMEITPIKSPNDQIVNYIAIKRDLTNERELEKQLRESQKLQAIGTLAGGIAHDFNNILMGMQLFTDITLKKLSPSSIEHKSLTKVREAEIRAKDLISQILTFSRQTGDEREKIMIHIVMKEALKMIKSTFPASIVWDLDIKDCGYIMGNPTHIHQILMNLCTNANHAMDGQGTISVSLDLLQTDPENISNDKLKHFKNWVRLIVKDSGRGISPEIRDRVFEPFFTTKAVGQGTGLGLATVHGIVKQYEGEIFFTSNVTNRTVFYIYLPTLI